MRQSVRHSLLLLSVFVLLLAGCGDPSLSALDPSGPVAESQLSLILLSLFIMIGVMAVVFAIFFYVIVRYRQKPGDDHIPEQVEGSTVLETIWIAIPIILLLILAVPTVATTFELAEQYPEGEGLSEEELEDVGIRVNVKAHQFWWEFEYPDYGVVTAQDVYMPVNERVYFELTSDDVIHSFWIPTLGGKIDTNPGEDVVNHFFLEASETGVFQGKCAELCGASHALMDFKAVAVERDEFDDWIESMQAFDEEEKSVSETAAQGREIFADSCIACHALDGENPSQGPNLAGYADRQTLAGFLENNEEHLIEWIQDPAQIKPEAKMPSAHELGLNEDEVSAVATYLLELTLDGNE